MLNYAHGAWPTLRGLGALFLHAFQGLHLLPGPSQQITRECRGNRHSPVQGQQEAVLASLGVTAPDLLLTPSELSLRISASHCAHSDLTHHILASDSDYKRGQRGLLGLRRPVVSSLLPLWAHFASFYTRYGRQGTLMPYRPPQATLLPPRTWPWL